MATPYDFAGIVSTADQTKATYLPLDRLDVYISIVDVSARVVLSQGYSHCGPDTLSEAYYVFPVPARAAVCSFELKTDNGARLKGIVKELSRAKEDYQEALSKGLLASLLEQFRQDGSMPPNTNVIVLLSYVVDLSADDEIETVRFQLPSHVRARYGAPSNSIVYYDMPHSEPPLNITVDITMPGKILEVTSLNHNPFIDLPVSPTTLHSPSAPHSRYFSRKRFSSNHCDLQPDFLLIVRAYGLGRPRCFAEPLSCEGNKSRSVVGSTTAFAFTIVPQFSLKMRPAHEYMEYIFLIDRSGSMGGGGIQMAKQALKLLLKNLSTNSMFNIYSFGSTFCSLWPGSQLYNDATFRWATIQIDSMEANLGGTELLLALLNVFASRQLNIPTSVFVLTDGQIYNIDTAVEATRVAVSNASVAAPLRVFTLGMGSGASTELCQRIASAGNGSCMMTVEGEPLALKALQLVKAMETPQVKNMSIDWGHTLVDQVRQAPQRIRALSPGMRLLVTAIIPGDHFPTHVTLKLDLADGTSFNYQVPVELLSDHVPEGLTEALGGTADVPPLIHTLAAHLLIQDVEGGDTRPLELQKLTAPSPETGRNIVKRYIVELGTQYQVASSCTAFIAVAAPTPSSLKQPKRHGNGNRSNSQSKNGTHSHQSSTNRKSDTTSPRTSGVSSHSASSKLPSTGSPTRGDGNKPPPSGISSESDDEGFMTPHSTVTGNSMKAPSPPRSSVSHAFRGKSGSGRSPSKSEATQSQSPTSGMPGAFKPSPDTGATTGPGWLFDIFAYNPLPGTVPVEVLCVPDPYGGSSMIFTAPPPPYRTTITTLAKSWLNSLKSLILPKYLPGSQLRTSQNVAWAFPRTYEPLVPAAILTIAGLQSSDGSFPSVTRELSMAVGIYEATLRSSAPQMVYGERNDAVWATAIAIAFWEKRLCGHVALWEDQAEKARGFGSTVCGGKENFEQIIQEALKLF